MTIELSRAALTRWGDPLLALALLLTNRRTDADAATIAAFTRTLATAPRADLEQNLYAALFGEHTRRRRLPRWPRRGALPRELSRIAPVDRFALGLWLLRGADGQQIAEITGLSPEELVERLSLVLAAVAPEIPAAHDDGHLTMRVWLAEQLGLPASPANHPRPCDICQRAQSASQHARDELQALLRRAVRQTQLSQASKDAIEEALAEGDESAPWWQRRSVWLGGLLAGVALALALMIAPRGTVPGTQPPAAPEGRALVQAALDGWTAGESSAPVHRQVWARDPRLHAGEPVITDLWLAGGGNTRHRVEVRRNGQLVEWQVADGRSYVQYAAEPADSSCRWNTGWSGHYAKFFRGPQRFPASAEEQRLVRDSRLFQGTYGLGYLALQRALAADDLRSFGARVEGKHKLVLLQFTDLSMEPARQIVLRIDPETKQLHAVQEVQVVSTQARSTDLWRLELSEVAADGVPLATPGGPPAVVHERLVDPACPALDPQYVVSPRVLLYSTRPSYVPEQLPEGAERLVLLMDDQTGFGSGRVPNSQDSGITLLMVGPGRWFSLSSDPTTPDGQGTQHTEGGWQVVLSGPSRDGILNGRIRLSVEGDREVGPVSSFWARGWSREEILGIIDSLVPFDSASWLALNDTFLEARPLAPEVDDALRRALQALQPGPNAAVELHSTTSVRVEPHENEPEDPYHIPRAQRFPATLVRHQLLQFEGGHITRYHDRRTIPNGPVYELLQNDGSRFHWYSHSQGIAYTGDEALLRTFVRTEQADVALLADFFSTEAAITRSVSFGHILLEQALRVPPSNGQDFRGPAVPHDPWYGDMPIGQWVRQLWLDSSSYRPLVAAITHRRPDGSETYVQKTTITERRELAQPPAEMFSLAALPATTLTVDVDRGEETVVEQIEEPRRLLAWPPSVGLEISETTTVPAADASRGGIETRSGWKYITGVPGTTMTSYGSASEVVVRLTQGQRDLLRHLLRHQPLPHDRDAVTAWSESERLRVEIAGQVRDAWLLTDEGDAVLVVEVDELLLHFSGSPSYLTGPLLELLPRLEWSEP